MVDVLRTWQGIERQAINDMAETIEETENPLIRLVMEIIRSDSLMHHRVQQFLIDSVTRKDVTVTREDVAKVWEKIEEHDKHEKQTIKLAEELRAEAWSPVHKQFLDYLLTDEKKHEELLAQLEDVKTGMSRSSGG
jgi:hypothetical protein